MDTLRSIAIAILLVAGAFVSRGFWGYVYLDRVRRTFRLIPEAREAFIASGQWLAFSPRSCARSKPPPTARSGTRWRCA